jgi:hypothetical protein
MSGVPSRILTGHLRDQAGSVTVSVSLQTGSVTVSVSLQTGSVTVSVSLQTGSITVSVSLQTGSATVSVSLQTASVTVSVSLLNGSYKSCRCISICSLNTVCCYEYGLLDDATFSVDGYQRFGGTYGLLRRDISTSHTK